MGIALLNHFQNVDTSSITGYRKFNEYSCTQKSISINFSKYGTTTKSMPTVASIPIDLSNVAIGIVMLKTSIRYAGTIKTISGSYQRIRLRVESAISALAESNTAEETWSTSNFDTYGENKVDESKSAITQSLFVNLTNGKSLIDGLSDNYGLESTKITDDSMQCTFTGVASASWGANGGETATGTVYFGPSTVELYAI